MQYYPACSFLAMGDWSSSDNRCKQFGPRSEQTAVCYSDSVPGILY